ncbi:hypothetical protein AB0I77_06215 [Streptomyces sp. NPDC050619]|uniref:hypothetical protein n=1 Tax=Streptomyces sp. NPDC050619 TaxID=3157214 RepID=UPI003414426F
MDNMNQADVDAVDLRLALITLNKVALAGVSGEAVTEIYRTLRKESPLANTILLSIANDRIGYLPQDSAYPLGTFEVNGCPIQQGYCQSTIVDGLTGLIENAVR